MISRKWQLNSLTKADMIEAFNQGGKAALLFQYCLLSDNYWHMRLCMEGKMTRGLRFIHLLFKIFDDSMRVRCQKFSRTTTVP